MTDQEWRQASDGQWYPVNQPKPANPNTKWIVLAMGGVLLVILVFGMVAQATGMGGSTEPSEPDARDMVWADMTTGERVGFCAEARAAGYQVVAAEMSDGSREDEREARYWLEDRCG